MRILLDTHLLLWSSIDPERLSRAADEMIAAVTNTPIFSIVSIWEVAIKRRLNRPDFDVDPRRFRDALLANGYEELPITAEHTFATALLPLLHRDPFDRMLVAQAASEGVLLLTADAQVAAYPGPVRQV